MRSLFLGKSPFEWLVRTVRDRGPILALNVMWHVILDASWDFVHGTETLIRIPPKNIETESGNKGQATSYGATRARPLMELFDRLDLPRDCGFVDLGAGKGRVVMIASLHGFRRVVGLEFSEPLCQLARKNLKAFGRRRKLSAEITIVHSDVVHYAIQSDDSVFFLYDPFSAEVMTVVLRNLAQSLEEHPRTIWLIYNSPRHYEVVERSGLFADSRDYVIGGNQFRVYANTSILACGKS